MWTSLSVVVQEAAGSGETGRINLSWFLRLRWAALVGQLALVVVVDWLLALSLPLWLLSPLLAIEGVTNLALARWLRAAPRVPPQLVAALMAWDGLVLTALLYLTGGSFNPFTTLYLVNVTLAAVVLPPRFSWALLALTLGAFGSLFLLQGLPPPGGLRLPDHATTMRLHIHGMWVAFAVAGLAIVYFVQRVTRALAVREQELAHARSLAARQEKLSSLATLAAGAAHELSTPLGTISLVAGELARTLSGRDTPAGAREDLELIRTQVRRCRDILQQMAAGAGENAGEPLVLLSARRWVEEALDGLPGRERVDVALDAGSEALQVRGPAQALARALRGLLRNALQASGAGGRVALRLALDGERLCAEVVDRGSGMDVRVLARAGEPFFTTKPPGEGMGLGLFLTRALAEQLGGSLALSSVAGHGTTARLCLPLSGAAAPRALSAAS